MEDPNRASGGKKNGKVDEVLGKAAPIRGAGYDGGVLDPSPEKAWDQSGGNRSGGRQVLETDAGIRPEPSLEDRFEGLNMHGEETVDLDFTEELDELIQEVRWLAIFRVHTTKPFSHAALFKSMRSAWASAQEVIFKVKVVNLFLVQFHCLGDWKRVMEGGPWLFRGAAVVIQEYDGFTNVTDYKLDKIPVWARIQGVPEGLMRKKDLAEKVARKVGEPPITVGVSEGKINPAKYLRARVFLDVNTPLVCFVPITIKEKKKYPVYYEKLPDFCSFCGLVGHVVEECGDGVHEDKHCEWGDWLLWNFEPAGSRTGSGRSVDGSGGRGEGRGDRGGRGTGRGSGALFEADSEYMDCSNLGGSLVVTDPKSVQKRLFSEDGSMISSRGGAGTIQLAGHVAGRVMMLENGTSRMEGVSTTSYKVPFGKRRRQDGDEIPEEDYLMNEAASCAEDRRDQ